MLIFCCDNCYLVAFTCAKKYGVWFFTARNSA
jgi:hypothetical protein